MFSFLFDGQIGSILAPSKADRERLAAFLERNQPEAALSLLQDNLTIEALEVDVPREYDGKRFIHIAAERGYGAVVLELLRARASIDATDPSSVERSALLIAANHNHPDLVEILLDRGADSSLRDSNGMDLIALAGSPALRERIVAWLAMKKAELKVEVHALSTPPTLSPRHPKLLVTPVEGFSATKEEPTGHAKEAVVLAAVETANAFVSPKERWRKVFNIFKSVQNMGANETQLAAFNSRLHADPSLASVRATGGTVKDGSTLLHAAADWGNVHSLKAILEAPACKDLLWSIDLQGRTALHVAAEKGNVDAAKILLAAMSTESGHPVGACAPTDLAGLTPSALNARESTKQRQSAAEKSKRSELKEILFRTGDASILPSVSFVDRCGGSHCAFGIAEAPGWRVAMEDAHCAYSPIMGDEGGVCSLFGVFDGHGGAFSGRFAASNFQQEFCRTDAWISQDLRPERLSGSLTEAMCNLDASLAAVPAMTWKGVEDTEDGSGATALVSLVTPSHLLVANSGDCRALLLKSSANAWISTSLTECHKPDLEKEKERIEGAGETVVKSRVGGVLAVSRSLGDFRFKSNLEKPPHEQAVVAVPEVRAIERTNDDEVLVLGSDGIWDVLDDKEVAAFLRQRLEGTLMDPESLAKCCDELIALCLERNSEDNMTVMAIRLDPPTPAVDRRIEFTGGADE